MSLPGLGIFTLDESVVLPEENDRALLSMPNAVQFQNANIASADKELINFICENTGKIRPLAISDLESYLNLGTEMLNIGNPFHLEGIGTITKNKTGKFDFTPGEYSMVKEQMDTPDHEKQKIYARDKKKVNIPAPVQNQNLLRIAALISALVIVGWGGWMMYKKSNRVSSEIINDTGTAVKEPSTISDSASRAITGTDSTKLSIKEPPGLSNDYKFVILATTNKPYALRRYNQLISYDLKVFLYQKDSGFFKVYFQFPALAKDTVHIKDSLQRQYAHGVTIER